MPQNLVLYFGRNIGKEYINNIIGYKDNMNFGDYHKSRKYKLNCVVENIRGAH